jgi:DAK2 domain fusion protein YloV
MAAHFFSRFARSRPKQPSAFNGQDFKRAVMAGHAWLEQHREAINALNVFPVPDGDTGTNMSLTMRAATKDIADSTETAAGAMAERLSRGALMGARGNSGVILSQILRGVSTSLADKDTFTAAEFAAALQEGAKLAYRAVIKPVEGTILTVARESAAAAQASAAHGGDLPAMLGDTVAAAKAAVAKTPDLLPILKQAGVVDAGAQGLTSILEGMWRFARGESVQMTHAEQREEQAEMRKGDVVIEEEFGYEVVFLLHGENLDVQTIRDTITGMGGVSTVVAGDSTLLKVHTHTETPGRILDYGVSLGSLQDINIENLQEQSLRYAADSARQHGRAAVNGATAAAGAIGANASATAVAAPPAAGEMPQRQVGEIGTVAVAAGDGWGRVFASLGVSRLVPGGQTMNPSTQDLLRAVEACPADKVIVLPNNGNIIMSARQVKELTKKQVCVMPSDSLPQGASALLAFSPDADFETNCAAMEAALKRVVTAEVTRAVRAVQLDGVDVAEGDVIGLVNGRLVAAGTEMDAVVRETLAGMQAEQREILTIYFGANVTAAQAEELKQRITALYPKLEVEVVEGGQPFYAYIISAE